VFCVVPMAIVSFRAVGRISATALLLVLCILGSLVAMMMEHKVEILVVLVLTYATVIGTMQQLTSAS